MSTVSSFIHEMNAYGDEFQTHQNAITSTVLNDYSGDNNAIIDAQRWIEEQLHLLSPEALKDRKKWCYQGIVTIRDAVRQLTPDPQDTTLHISEIGKDFERTQKSFDQAWLSLILLSRIEALYEIQKKVESIIRSSNPR